MNYNLISLKKYILSSILKVAPSAGLISLFIPYFLFDEPLLFHYFVFLIIGAVGGSLISAPFAFLVGYKKFLQPANSIILHIDEISHKDLSKNIPTNNLGYLSPVGTCVNDMTNNLNNEIKTIQIIADNMNVTSIANFNRIKNMHSESQKVLNFIKENKDELNVLTNNLNKNNKLMNEFNNEINNFSHLITDSVTDFSNINTLIHKNKIDIGSIQNSFTDFNQKYESITSMVSEFNNKINKIYEIIEVIEKISGKTNLLALNASLESTRSGNDNNGFKIVADEIKKLSEQSNRSTKFIKDLISNIHVDSSTITEEVYNAKEHSDSLKNKLTSLNKKLSEISTRVNNSHERNQNISKGIKDVTNDTNTVSENTQHSLEFVNNYSQSTLSINKNIENIIHDISNYKSTIEFFKEVSKQLYSLTDEYKTKK